MNNILSDWQIFTFDEVSSTNDVIKDYCTQKGKKIAVLADSQTSGRGRRGRSWLSLRGNLFFSFALEANLQDLGMLVSITSLSLWQTLHKLSPCADLEIKWPNDILLDKCKISGILLEKGPDDYIIIGIGVNVKSHPQNSNMLYSTASLNEKGININPKELMLQFLEILNSNLQLWAKGMGNKLRQQWLAAVKGIGKTIEVRQEKQKLTGIFKGIDENAHLLLENDDGICQIRAGDVFYIEKE